MCVCVCECVVHVGVYMNTHTWTLLVCVYCFAQIGGVCLRESECLRVVKLAETARAAHRFSELHHSSLDEEWLRTLPAMLPSGLGSLYSLSLSPCVSVSITSITCSAFSVDPLHSTPGSPSAASLSLCLLR